MKESGLGTVNPNFRQIDFSKPSVISHDNNGVISKIYLTYNRIRRLDEYYAEAKANMPEVEDDHILCQAAKEKFIKQEKSLFNLDEMNQFSINELNIVAFEELIKKFEQRYFSIIFDYLNFTREHFDIVSNLILSRDNHLELRITFLPEANYTESFFIMLKMAKITRIYLNTQKYIDLFDKGEADDQTVKELRALIEATVANPNIANLHITAIPHTKEFQSILTKINNKKDSYEFMLAPAVKSKIPFSKFYSGQDLDEQKLEEVMKTNSIAIVYSKDEEFAKGTIIFSNDINFNLNKTYFIVINEFSSELKFKKIISKCKNVYRSISFLYTNFSDQQMKIYENFLISNNDPTKKENVTGLNLEFKLKGNLNNIAGILDSYNKNSQVVSYIKTLKIEIIDEPSKPAEKQILINMLKSLVTSNISLIEIICTEKLYSQIGNFTSPAINNTLPEKTVKFQDIEKRNFGDLKYEQLCLDKHQYIANSIVSAVKYYELKCFTYNGSPNQINQVVSAELPHTNSSSFAHLKQLSSLKVSI